MSNRRVSAIDIGTNSVKLLVAKTLRDGGVRTICERVVVTRLGEGLSKSGRLSPNAMSKTMRVLEQFRTTCERHRAWPATAVSTAVLRNAKNATVFVRRCRETLGLDVKIISGQEEALLTCKGALTGLPAKNGFFLDIGGGSTEVIHRRRGKIAWSRSFPIGAVNLTERFFRRDPPTPRELEHCARTIRSTLHPLTKIGKRPPLLIGIGGTIVTLGALVRKLSAPSPERLHNRRMSAAAVRAVFGKLAALPLPARRKVRGMDKARSDIILAGAQILLEAMSILDCKSVTISTRGLRHAIISYTRLSSFP